MKKFFVDLTITTEEGVGSPTTKTIKNWLLGALDTEMNSIERFGATSYIRRYRVRKVEVID